ncbi:hypothetical protein NDN08_005339 [Rhodosorus marinus]|uniref:Uncharacterized protein n=1 Tax=Rhodosorus marinus TaxID=101924 RepID=A0AAV8V329_9RHOD|nr:hypothetical protein NDN08_005339 [Rhodosorus marinus]
MHPAHLKITLYRFLKSLDHQINVYSDWGCRLSGYTRVQPRGNLFIRALDMHKGELERKGEQLAVFRSKSFPGSGLKGKTNQGYSFSPFVSGAHHGTGNPMLPAPHLKIALVPLS